MVGALALPVLFLPLTQRPLIGFAAVGAAVAVALALRSPAYPLALSALPAAVFALTGANPFPSGVVVVLAFAWMSLAVAFRLLRRPGSSIELLGGRVVTAAPVVFSLILTAVMLAGLGDSAAAGYGGDKVELFVTANLAVLVTATMVGADRKDFDLYLGLTLAVASISAGVLFIEVASGDANAAYAGRYTISGTDPITLGRQAGVGLLVALYLLVASRAVLLRICALSALPLLTVALVATGGRGPVVGVAVGMIAFFALAGADPVSRRRLPLTILGGLVAVVLVSQLVPGQATNRALSVLTGTGAGLSSNGRSELWSQASSAFDTHPLLGLGTGGFAAVNPANVYPHNLVLEVAAELGLAGLIPLLGALVGGLAILIGTWRRAAAQDRARPALIIALFVAALANAFFSGDITINSQLWLTMGLAVGLARSLRTESGAAAGRTSPPE